MTSSQASTVLSTPDAEPGGFSPKLQDGEELIGTARVPDGVELQLVRHGKGFTILLENTELMSTEANASEEALATMTCARLGDNSSPQLLIGGYGMGYTLRAALAQLDERATIYVAELVPEIIAWARGPMRKVTAGCLDDPRVTVIDADVATLIGAARGGYDAILLDVDNGPEGLTTLINDRLYCKLGLEAAMRALRPGGILAVWSAFADAAFTTRLEEAGFAVEVADVDARPGDAKPLHVIWFARKPG